MRELLKAETDPNATDRDGGTALNLALNDINVVKELMQGGADPNQGERPLIFDAIQHMNLNLVHVLVENGADCNLRSLPSMEEDQPQTDSSYPLENAAWLQAITKYHRLTINSTIEVLLAGGANPC